MASDAEEIAQLKTEVAHLRQLVEQLYFRSGQPMPSGVTTPGAAIPADVEQALRAGNLIMAIKLWRSYTGLGLREAKDQVEQMRSRLG